MRLETLLAKTSATGMFWGIIGGLSLIITTISTNNGYIQVVPYFFILCAAVLTTKYMNKSRHKFLDLFKSGFFAFMISSVFLYTFIVIAINPNSGIDLIGHLWRFGIIALVGIVITFIISFLAKPVR